MGHLPSRLNIFPINGQPLTYPGISFQVLTKQGKHLMDVLWEAGLGKISFVNGSLFDYKRNILYFHILGKGFKRHIFKIRNVINQE